MLFRNPTPDESLGTIWHEYDNDKKYYIDINDNLTLGQNLDDEVIAFWDNIYEEQ